MKRSFYQMLGVEANADQSQLDAAYAAAAARLNAAEVRGANEAISEIRVLRDGYQLLSDATRRAQYDAKLAELEAIENAEVTFYEDSPRRRKPGVKTAIFVSLIVVLGGSAYSNISRKMDEISTAQKQAYAKAQQQKQNKTITLDTTITLDPEHPDPRAFDEAVLKTLKSSQ